MRGPSALIAISDESTMHVDDTENFKGRMADLANAWDFTTVRGNRAKMRVALLL